MPAKTSTVQLSPSWSNFFRTHNVPTINFLRSFWNFNFSTPGSLFKQMSKLLPLRQVQIEKLFWASRTRPQMLSTSVTSVLTCAFVTHGYLTWRNMMQRGSPIASSLSKLDQFCISLRPGACAWLQISASPAKRPMKWKWNNKNGNTQSRENHQSVTISWFTYIPQMSLNADKKLNFQ